MGKAKEQNSKAAKAAKAVKGSKKKKWSKGRVGEKLENKVQFDQSTWAAFQKGVPKIKIITISKLSSQFNITGSLARKGIMQLEKDGVIVPRIKHSSFLLYVPAPQE